MTILVVAAPRREKANPTPQEISHPLPPGIPGRFQSSPPRRTQQLLPNSTQFWPKHGQPSATLGRRLPNVWGKGWGSTPGLSTGGRSGERPKVRSCRISLRNELSGLRFSRRLVPWTGSDPLHRLRENRRRRRECSRPTPSLQRPSRSQTPNEPRSGLRGAPVEVRRGHILRPVATPDTGASGGSLPVGDAVHDDSRLHRRPPVVVAAFFPAVRCAALSFLVPPVAGPSGSPCCPRRVVEGSRRKFCGACACPGPLARQLRCFALHAQRFSLDLARSSGPSRRRPAEFPAGRDRPPMVDSPSVASALFPRASSGVGGRSPGSGPSAGSGVGRNFASKRPKHGVG